MSNVPMTLPEQVLAVHETNYGHCSSFVQLDDGRILHVGGGDFTTSEDGGITWSKAVRRNDTNGNPVSGSEISLVKLSGKNSIGLAARILEEPTGTSYACPAESYFFLFWRSDDNGETWRPPIRMTAPGIRTAGYQDTFLRTASGRIILPVFVTIGQRGSGPGDQPSPSSGKLVNNQFVPTAGHFFDPGFSAVYIVYSDDDGETWHRNHDGELMILHDWNCMFSYVNESSVTEVSPGKLLMFMRNGLGRLFQAWSNDNGETWTRPQPSSLASPTAPAQIRTLPNGHLLVVWTQESPEEIRRGFGRTRISSAISRNGGSIWEFFQNVESMHETTRVEPGPIEPVRPAEQYFKPGLPAAEREAEHVIGVDFHGRWSYPSVFVMQDRVLIAHTYAVFEEHPTRAELTYGSGGKTSFNQKLKVLPLKWFYGGKEPCDSPWLRKTEEPAKP